MSFAAEDVYEIVDGLLVGGGCLYLHRARFSRDQHRDIVEGEDAAKALGMASA